MTFHDSATSAVLDAASSLEKRSREIGIMRSVDATESSRWLQEIAKRLRDSCLPEEEGSLPLALHRAADLLTQWEAGGAGREEKMTEAFAEICAAHDALLGNFRGREVYSSVVRERDGQLKLLVTE